MIKAILFDIDGVLVDSGEVNALFRQEVFLRAGYDNIDPELIKESGKPQRIAIIDALSSRGVTSQKEIDRVLEIAKNISFKQTDKYIFPEELEPILKKLKQRFKLGVVSNRRRRSLNEIFDLRPVEKYFEVIVTFDDVANYKPHPEPLEKAIKTLGIEPKEAVYIGDSDVDIIAASTIGMPSIHLSESKHHLAHQHIIEFSEILNAVKLIEENANNNT